MHGECRVQFVEPEVLIDCILAASVLCVPRGCAATVLLANLLKAMVLVEGRTLHMQCSNQ